MSFLVFQYSNPHTKKSTPTCIGNPHMTLEYFPSPTYRLATKIGPTPLLSRPNGRGANYA